MYWSSLKISHPLGNWLFTTLLSAIGGIYFMFTGVKALTTPQGIYISVDAMFWVGLGAYLISTMGFLFLKIHPRFKRMPAGADNMVRLENFIGSYPDIAKELSLETLLRDGATFGQLKKIQKDANRKVVQMASKSIVRGGNQ